jgi:hypothetical protein
MSAYVHCATGTSILDSNFFRDSGIYRDQVRSTSHLQPRTLHNLTEDWVVRLEETHLSLATLAKYISISHSTSC